MKKALIITFTDSDNYGAFWQAYALQKKCNELCDTKLINYTRIKPTKISNKNIIKRSYFVIRKILHDIIINKKKYRKFIEDKEKYLELTIQQYNKNNIIDIEQEDTFFITGSDQVWNPRNNKNDYSFLLNFVKDPNKRNSYAASFGGDYIPEKNREKYKEILNTFKNISVRELQGQKIIKDLIGKDVPTVLDPTLLLNKSDWEKSINYMIENKEKYILIYSLSHSSKIIEHAKELSKKTGLKIKYLKTSLRTVIGTENIYHAGPEDFIKLFLGAEYVLTNSFHGTAFSINFNKKFFVELDTVAKVKNRITNILEVLNLENRIINNNITNKLLDSIDYENVNKKLNKLRNDSINYLKNIFNQ
ncbi:MAG: polysaccharide pyruvyl transferase family protein [Christensenellales bacterium]